jgi:nicotinate-nucleotide adenylyltransferase
VEKYLPLSVETYIKDNKLYRNLGERIGDYKVFTEFCARILFANKGINVKGYDLTAMSAPSEYTLIASGTSTRHAAAMAENIVVAVKEEFNVHPQSVEGMDEGRWVLVDYGSLIIHVFYDFVRQEYSLENLWRQGKDLGLKDPFVGKPEAQ